MKRRSNRIKAHQRLRYSSNTLNRNINNNKKRILNLKLNTKNRSLRAILLQISMTIITQKGINTKNRVTRTDTINMSRDTRGKRKIIAIIILPKSTNKEIMS